MEVLVFSVDPSDQNRWVSRWLLNELTISVIENISYLRFNQTNLKSNLYVTGHIKPLRMYMLNDISFYHGIIFRNRKIKYTEGRLK